MGYVINFVLDKFKTSELRSDFDFESDEQYSEEEGKSTPRITKPRNQRFTNFFSGDSNHPFNSNRLQKEDLCKKLETEEVNLSNLVVAHKCKIIEQCKSTDVFRKNNEKNLQNFKKISIILLGIVRQLRDFFLCGFTSKKQASSIKSDLQVK